MNLSSNERVALERGDPVRIEEGGLDCVLVRADVYERISRLTNGEASRIEDRLATIWADVPDSEWSKLPADFSERLDQHLYGTHR